MPATSRVRARSLRLGAKLQLLLAAGSLAILAGVLAVQTLQRVSDTYTDRRDANLRIARVMAGPLSSALPIADPAAVYGYMEILEKDPAAAAVVIVKDGEVTKSQQSLEHLDMPLEALQAVALDAAASNSDRVADEGDFEFVGVPVADSAGRVMGALGIGWSTEGLYARIWRDALVQAGAVAAACLVLLWLLDRAVRRLVTGPLGALADAVERDTAGGEGRESTAPVLDHEARADEIGTLARALGQFRRRAGEVRTLNAHFDAALGNMTQGLCLFDARGRLLVHNRCFAAMFGTPPPGAAAAALGSGREMEGMFDPPDPAGRDGEDRRAHELADGRVVQVSRRAIADGGWVATFEDVTERRRSQERLSYMARHDALTSLPNRVLLREHMEHVLARVRRGGGAAVLCLDLDGFKGVNDTLGHPAGDELLRQVARRLKGCTRETDLVARLGGDEFAIVQEDAEQPADATVLAGRLVEALRAPFELHGQWVEIGTSIGVASADAAVATPDELLRGADIALYRAKADGRGTWRFFEPGMDAEMQARRALEADLRRALAEGQFELYYQPLVAADTRALAGFEALVRWCHPERGMVSPGEFIPLAEATGLIRPLGAWVLARACADAARWPEHVKVAVNLSPAQFAKGDLMGEVERALAASGLPAYRLELEITESVLLRDNAATLGVLHRLRALGVSIAMDDFGTGYSSLSYLRSFPFDKIKVDQSFVRDLGRGKGGVEIVRAVVGLGQALGMCVLAEGVETAEQLAVLRDEGCDEVQGYLFSRPRPVRDVPGIIAGYPAAKADPAPGPVLVPVLVIDNAGNGDTGDGQAAA